MRGKMNNLLMMLRGQLKSVFNNDHSTPVDKRLKFINDELLKIDNRMLNVTHAYKPAHLYELKIIFRRFNNCNAEYFYTNATPELLNNYIIIETIIDTLDDYIEKHPL